MLISKNKKYAEQITDWQGKLAAPWVTKYDVTSLYPWFIIMFCALFTFYKFVLQVSPSVMTSELMQAFEINAAGLGNLAATYFYAYLAAQFVVGPLLDRYSPRYLTAFAIFLCACGTLLFANAHSLWIAGIARAFIGIGVAFSTVSYMKMSAIWFGSKKIAFIDGLLATAAMFGALCGQVPLLLVIAHSGWQHGLMYCGFFGMILSMVFIVCVRDKKINLSPTNGYQSSLKLTDFFILLRTKRNWLLAGYAGFAFTPLSVIGGLWGNPFFITAYHLTPTQAASLSSSMFVGLGLGAPLLGLLADQYLGRIKTMALGTSMALIALILIIYAHLRITELSLLLFIFGAGTGAFMSCYAFGKEFNNPQLAASVISLINSGDALLGSFTEPLIGKILDYFWQGKILAGIHVFPPVAFHYAFSLLPIYLLCAMFCLLLLSQSKKSL